MSAHPDLPDPQDLAAAGPRAAKKTLTKLASPLPAAELAPFFEQACRELTAAGEIELATWCFAQARTAEKNHPGLLDLDRVQGIFLELVPAGGVAPAALRDYATLLGEHLAPDEAHTRFRAVICAGLDAGLIPYARIFPDLRKLAKAAKIKKRDEERFLAERLLRAGVLPGASHQVWAAAREPLGAVAGADNDLMDLLIAAEPDSALHTEESGEEVAEEIRQMWLESLAEAGAGARVPLEWFATSGRRCVAEVLLRLAEQAGERLGPPGGLGGESDPAHHPDFRITYNERSRSDADYWWGTTRSGPWQGFETGKAAAELTAGAGERDHIALRLDAFVRTMDHARPDDVATLHGLWDVPEIRRVLRELVGGWAADLARPALPVLSGALSRLVQLAGAGYLELEPGLAGELRPADPADALLATLRGGLPAEVSVPVVGAPARSKAARSVLQHHGHLTVCDRAWHCTAYARGDDGSAHSVWLPKLPEGALPWYDGDAFRLSWARDGRWRTFLIEEPVGDTVALTLEPELFAARPEAPGVASVSFPGAEGPSTVRLDRGTITVTAPDGTVTARVAFSPLQKAKEPLVPPPGRWSQLAPADPEGSLALRRLDRARAERLLEAAVGGRRDAAAALPALLPELTAPVLRDAVVDAACAAAGCLLLSIELRERAGLPQPSSLPALVSPHPDLPFRRNVRATGQLVNLRLLAAEFAAAMAEPAADRPYLIGVVPPRGTGVGSFALGTLGAQALAAALPWTPPARRDTILDALRLCAGAPFGDGTGTLRFLRLTPAGGKGQSEAERQQVDRRLTESAPGELWRTPTGVLMIQHYQRHDRTAFAVEHTPGVTFAPVDLPGWTLVRPPVRAWGNIPQITGFLRQLAEQGPAKIDLTRTVHDLAEQAALDLPTAAAIAFDLPPETQDPESEHIRTTLLALRTDPSTGTPARPTVPLFHYDALREPLMPADPAALWTEGPSTHPAATWWHTHTNP